MKKIDIQDCRNKAFEGLEIEFFWVICEIFFELYDKKIILLIQ